MNVKKADELLFVIGENADSLIEQTNTRPKETLDVKLTESMEAFSLGPPLELEKEN